MRVDFPAAHSMDTDWFAVDADGNVGLFDSTEDGAVPNAAATLGGAGEPSFDADVFYAGLAARRLATGEWKPTDDDRAWCATQETAARILLVLAAAPEPELLEQCEVFAAGAPWIGLSRKPLPAAKIRALAEREGLVAALTDRMVRDQFERAEVFVFSRDHGDDPGSYEQVSAPANPLRVDELPASAATAVGSLRLPVSFAAGTPVHLADHMADGDASYWHEDWTLRGFGAPPGTPLPRRERRARIIVALVVIGLVIAIAIRLLAR